MLTLVQTKDAVPLLGIYAAPRPGDKSTSMRKKQTGTVYFTHELDTEHSNVSDAGGVLALHTDVARELHAAGYGPEHDGDLRQSDLEGRRPLYFLGGAEANLVLRRFSHGGLLRWLTGARYLDPERPFRELMLVDSLLRAGVRTPRASYLGGEP